MLRFLATYIQVARFCNRLFYVEQFLMRLIFFVFNFLKLECGSIPILCTVTEITKQNFVCIFFCLGSDFVNELYSECFHTVLKGNSVWYCSHFCSAASLSTPSQSISIISTSMSTEDRMPCIMPPSIHIATLFLFILNRRATTTQVAQSRRLGIA